MRVPVATVLEGLDLQPSRPKRVEMVLLVTGAKVRQHLAERRGIAGDLLAGGHPTLQRDQVAAGEVVAEVGRGVHRTAVGEKPH